MVGRGGPTVGLVVVVVARYARVEYLAQRHSSLATVWTTVNSLKILRSHKVGVFCRGGRRSQGFRRYLIIICRRPFKVVLNGGGMSYVL